MLELGLAFLQRDRVDDALALDALQPCLLYTSDAADERSSVDLGGRRIIKKKNAINIDVCSGRHATHRHIRC